MVLDGTGEGFGRRLAITIAGGDSTNTALMPIVQAVPPAELTQAESVATRRGMRKEKTGYIVVNQQTLAGGGGALAGDKAPPVRGMGAGPGGTKKNNFFPRPGEG